MSHILFITLATFYFNSSLPLFILLAHVMTVTRYITLTAFLSKDACFSGGDFGLVLTIFNEGAYLTLKSIFLKALNLS